MSYIQLLSRLVVYPATRVDHCPISAIEECAKMGNARLFNTMILGGYLKVCPIVDMEYVKVGLKKSLPERAWKTLLANEEAIIHGGKIITLIHKAE